MDFIERFRLPNSYLALGTGWPVKNAVWQFVSYTDPLPAIPSESDTFFGPAQRSAPGNEKGDVIATKVLWIDVDDTAYPQTTLPASMAVFSGHGWHLYWVLDEPVQDVSTIEELNKILEGDCPTADKGCWNANRLLRLPGTRNNKDPQAPVGVELRSKDEAFVYRSSDIQVLQNLDKKTKHKIRTGDRRGYASRSERDWAVVTALLGAGASEELIRFIFTHQKVGDKFRDPETPRAYLDRTISEAQHRTKIARRGDFEERADGYYSYGKGGARRVSTFVILPELLLDGTAFGASDAIVGSVEAAGHRWRDVTFTRSAFTSVAKLDRECPIAAWQWLGPDPMVRQLLPYLLDQMHEKGFRRVAAVPALGLYSFEGQWYFAGDHGTLTAQGYFPGYTGSLAWLPNMREHPTVNLPPGNADLPAVASVSRLNEPEAIWPMIGWYAAAALKPWLEAKGYRFPILSVTGTRGSGKTTLIQRVMMPLFGQADPRSYDAGTTKFVVLALLGSTNAVPISFSEFRYSAVENFLRYVLLAYDTGHDPRGRADQTTQDYPLSAPFSVDGEDLIVDPAALQRMIVVQLDPAAIDEGSTAYNAFRDLRARSDAFQGFGGSYVQWILSLLASGSLDGLLAKAAADVFEAYPQRLPDRVRNNHIVVWLGIKLFCTFVQIELPNTEVKVLDRSVRTVFNIAAGRGRTLGDDFVEAVVNAAAGATNYFKWEYDEISNTLWFQLVTAHGWWLAVQRKRGRTGLERSAVRNQLVEAPYCREPVMRQGMWMYGVSLEEACRMDLDVPERLYPGKLSLNI